MGAAASGGLLLGRPTGALAQSLGPTDEYGTARASRLFAGTWVAHADMHNHTLLSDGDGDAAMAFASMRDAGLDIACLTDHSTLSKDLAESPCLDNTDCQSLAGLDENAWALTEQLADGANTPGAFTAIRGFEWSSPTLGHMNVWFSQGWTDPLHTGGLGTVADLLKFAHGEGLPDDGLGFPTLEAIIDLAAIPGEGMALWYQWLKLDPGSPVTGGGSDGIAGFNHPGRENGRFSDFSFDAGLVDRLVSLELFNRREDYLFERVDDGRDSPLVACLDAGWRPGILGVTDEHGTDWGYPDGKGRGGLWVTELTRAGVRDAMERRRFFATNLKGLRLDAAANGVRMGQPLTHTSGTVTFQVDIDRGAMLWGQDVLVQVLQTGSPLPTIVHTEQARLPTPDEPVIRFDAPIDIQNGDWVVLRVTDPTLEPDGRADAVYAAAGGAIAYASPFWLTTDGPPPPGPIGADPAPEPEPVPVPAGDVLPSTGGGVGLAALATAGLLALRRRGTDHDHEGHGHG